MSVLYAIAADQTVFGWEWATRKRVNISPATMQSLENRLVLQLRPENGGSIVLGYGNAEPFGTIRFDSHGLPTVVEDASGHIAFLGDGPRQKPHCIFGEVIAPYRACADLVMDETISQRILDALAKAEYPELLPQ